MLFADRRSAGDHLAATLQRFNGQDVVVLGLPRGGVPVASIVAEELDAPLDVIVVRKLGLPSHPELAMGAIGEGGVRIVNEEVVQAAGITAAEFASVEAREREELVRQSQLFRGGRSRVDIAGKTAIIVDDGIATGSTAWAACKVARALGAARVVLATPVGARQAVDELRGVADDVVCLETPEPFHAVGQWYQDFSATSDAEVQALVRPPARQRSVDVGVVTGSIRLPGTLTIPPNASGLVVFAHGSGSSRKSPRNRWVAEFLNGAGFATMLFDLLTPFEQTDRTNVFDIDLLGGRLVDADRDRSAVGLRCVACPSATSGRAPVPRPRCGPRPSPTSMSAPWSPAAVDRTWLARGCAASLRRRF